MSRGAARSTSRPLSRVLLGIGLAGAAGLVLLLVFWAGGPGQEEGPPAWSRSADRTSSASPSAGKPAIETAREEFLASELEAARSHQTYLVLEPRQKALELKSEGFLLHRFPLSGAALGLPRWGPTPSWPAVTFRLASEPPEAERRPIPIQPPPPPPGNNNGAAGPRTAGSQAVPPGEGGASPAGELPDPDRDEMKRLPVRYSLLFEPGLEVAIAGESSGADVSASLWRLLFRFGGGWQAVSSKLSGRPPRPRLLLIMSRQDARRLCLALRHQSRLLVAVPDDQPASQPAARARPH